MLFYAVFYFSNPIQSKHGFRIFFQTLFVDSVEFTQFFTLTIIILMDVSLFCWFGHETTTNYENIFCVICSHWCWYTFPLDIQKLIPMILANAEQLVYLKGYFGVYCTRDFITTVRNPIIYCDLLKLIDFYHFSL